MLETEKHKPAFVGILSNGTSGDINNINYGAAKPGPKKPYEQIRLVADRVARAAHEAYRGIKHRDWVPLAVADRDIDLGVRLPSAADVAKARETIAQAKGGLLRTLPEVDARETG